MRAFRSFRSARTADFGIDIGSANTVVVSARDGVLFHDATCLAPHPTKPGAFAIGTEAASMEGRTDELTRVTHPFSRGRVSDADALHTFLGAVFNAAGIPRSGRATASIGTSFAASHEDQTLVKRIGHELGLNKVHFIPDITASAIAQRGERDPDRPLAIVDVGADLTEWAVVRGGTVVTSGWREVGVKDFADDLTRFMRRRGLQLTRAQAESLLASLGCRGERNPALTARVGCRDVFSGKLGGHFVSAGDLRDALRGRLDDLCLGLKKFFDEQPEPVLRGLLDSGVDLCGGGALIPDFSLRLSKGIGLTMTVAPNPLQTAAVGAARTIVSWDGA